MTAKTPWEHNFQIIDEINDKLQQVQVDEIHRADSAYPNLYVQLWHTGEHWGISIPELSLWNVWNADDEYPLDIQAELRKIAKLIMLAFPEPAEEEAQDPGFDPIALGE